MEDMTTFSKDIKITNVKNFSPERMYSTFTCINKLKKDNKLKTFAIGHLYQEDPKFIHIELLNEIIMTLQISHSGCLIILNINKYDYFSKKVINYILKDTKYHITEYQKYNKKWFVNINNISESNNTKIYEYKKPFYIEDLDAVSKIFELIENNIL